MPGGEVPDGEVPDGEVAGGEVAGGGGPGGEVAGGGGPGGEVLGGDARRAAAAHVFVDDVAHPELAAEDRHHLERVLRLRAGEYLTVTDGRGGWRWARFGPGANLEPVGDPEFRQAPRPTLTVAFALVKGDRPEWAVQKLTEAGVDRIIPMTSDRCVVRWDPDRSERHLGRLRVIARQAAMQSRRDRLPEVGPLQTFEEVLATTERGAALALPGGGPPSLDHPTILVGPEGGWSPAEESRNLPSVGLGPGVLRSESAAFAAGVLLAALRAGLVRPLR